MVISTSETTSDDCKKWGGGTEALVLNDLEARGINCPVLRGPLEKGPRR
jgi:hypothetical protein